MQQDVLTRLFSGAADPSARRQFDSAAGWRYGLLWGSALTVVTWGLDAIELFTESAALFWPKLLLAILLVIPLCTITGLLAGRSHASIGGKFVVWLVCGALTGWIAVHLPFEGVSLLMALVDPATRGITIWPFVPAAEERVIPLMLLGGGAGLAAAVLQNLTTQWAWDRSTADNRITLRGWLVLFLAAPLALGLGALYDGAANAQLRAPLYLMHRVIRVALDNPPDLDLQQMPTGKLLDYVAARRWRPEFSDRFAQHLADMDPTNLRSGFVDVEFDNGFIWRCEVLRNGENLAGCSDVKATFTGYVKDFLATGDATCDNCFVRIDPAAGQWRVANSAALGDIRTVQITHHSGSIVLALAHTTAGKTFECRFTGARTVNLEACALQ